MKNKLPRATTFLISALLVLVSSEGYSRYGFPSILTLCILCFLTVVYNIAYYTKTID